MQLINYSQTGEDFDKELLDNCRQWQVKDFEEENAEDSFWAKTFLVVAMGLTVFFWLWLFPELCSAIH